jgi:hypothetical protein
MTSSGGPEFTFAPALSFPVNGAMQEEVKHEWIASPILKALGYMPPPARGPRNVTVQTCGISSKMGA